MSYNRFSCLDNKYPQNTLKNKNKNKNNVFDYISFPELVSSKNKTPENIYNFKKILTDTNEYIEPLVTKQEFILPGWEKLTLKRIKNNHEVQYDASVIMEQTISNMEKNWKKFEDYYNDINGDGSFEEKFRLPLQHNEEHEYEYEYAHEEQNSDNEMD